MVEFRTNPITSTIEVYVNDGIAYLGCFRQHELHPGEWTFISDNSIIKFEELFEIASELKELNENL